MKAALLKSGGVLKVSAKDTLISLDEASQGTLDVVVEIGNDRYCSRCTAAEVDAPVSYRTTACTAPPACP